MVVLRNLVRAFLSFNSEGEEVTLEDAFKMGLEVAESDNQEEGASCLAVA